MYIHGIKYAYRVGYSVGPIGVYHHLNRRSWATHTQHRSVYANIFNTYEPNVILASFSVQRYYLLTNSTAAMFLLATEATERVDRTYFTSNKQLSYRRQTALQGGLVMAKSGRLELRDNIQAYGHYKSIFNHCDVIGQQNNQILYKKNAK